MCCASSLSAQSTHVIELAIIEVRYNVVHGTDKDQYAYRCGRNVSQYFSVNNLRDDSLRASPDPAISSIVLDEMLAEALNRNDPSKRRPTSPGRGDYMYWNMPEGKISVYTSVMGSKYVAEEDIPSMEWEINEDSVTNVTWLRPVSVDVNGQCGILTQFPLVTDLGNSMDFLAWYSMPSVTVI